MKRRDRDLADQIDAEIRAHIALRTEELIAGGMDPGEARAEAERRFGDREAARGALYRSARRREGSLRRRAGVDQIGRDLGLAFRRIGQAPGFAALAVVVFGLGIGLTTTMFTIVDQVLLRPLPYPEPERLVALHSVGEDRGWFPYVSQGNWLDWKERNTTLAGAAIYAEGRVSVADDEGAFYVPRARVGGPFFEVIGAPMRVGRPFSEQEGQDEAAVAVVSQGFWERVMEADTGLTDGLIVGGRSVRVVGVVAAGSEFPQGTEIWLPYRYRRQTGALRNNINWFVVARLLPGVGIVEARDDLSAIADAIRQSDPEALYSWGVHVQPLHERMTRGATDTLTLLMGAVGFVFLVACANLAGINFARASARRREIAVRVALGAGRGRIIQQQLIESLALASLGGGLGVLLAAWGTAAVAASAAAWVPRAAEVAVDGWVLAFAVVVSVLAGVLAGLAPAIGASRAAPRAWMGAGARLAGGPGRGPGTFLVAGEIALAVLLCVGAGLLVRSFTVLVGRDLGFDPRGLVTAGVTLSSPRYLGNLESWPGFWDELMERAGALAGVASVAVAAPAPTEEGGNGFVDVEGRPDLDDGAAYVSVSDDFFTTLRIPLLAGRVFNAGDTAAGERVTVASRTLAESFWPGENPLGKRIKATSMEAPEGSPWLTVIGVVADIRQYGFEEETPQNAMYVLHRQVPRTAGTMTLLARTDPESTTALFAPLRAHVRDIDPALAADLDTLEGDLAREVSSQRLVASLLGSFAGIALLLAAIGIYGLQSFAVVQRTREIAIRSALGARRARVVALVLGAAARVAAAGTVIGLLGAWWLAGLMEAFVVDVSPRDPTTFLAVAAILLSVGVLAAALPAWRAARLDPLQALRRT